MHEENPLNLLKPEYIIKYYALVAIFKKKKKIKKKKKAARN